MPNPLRPVVHLAPERGWLNDPNGLLVEDGRLHCFFQYEPDAPRWGTMHWGHASTADLVTWDHHPVAFGPTPGGPDALGCWSGCVVRDDDGAHVAFYTGVSPREGLRHAAICRAAGDASLEVWRTEPTPVIDGAPPGIRPDMFRDPFVWREGPGWAMAVGAGTDAGRGAVLLYRSVDLRCWTYAGPLLTTEALVVACPDLDVAEIDSTCWECPQVVRLDDLACLIISIVDRSPVVRPARVVAITGRLVGDRFLPLRAQRLGIGPDFYAPATTTLPDGRVLLLGWIPEDPPGTDDARDWAGAMTLPRTVSLDEAGRPRIRLVEELASLGPAAEAWEAIEVSDSVPWMMELGSLHAAVDLVVRPWDAPLRLDVRAGGVLVADVRFDPRSRQLTATRNGRIEVAGRSPTGGAVLPPSAAERLELRIMIDGTVLELVAADVVTATVRLPPLAGPRTMVATAFGGACLLERVELRTLAGAAAAVRDRVAGGPPGVPNALGARA